MFGIGQGDLLPDMEIELNGGEDLAGATDIVLVVLKPDDTVAELALTDVDLNVGLVKREWAAGDTAVPGLHQAVVQLQIAGEQRTYPADGTRLRWIVWP